MLKNKKAWLRILEAFIAIILIASVLIVLYSRTIEKSKKTGEIYKLQESILDEVTASSEYREDILNDSKSKQEIENFIAVRVPVGFNFGVRICEVEEICELKEYKGEEGKAVYSSERIVSSTLETYGPKKLKIFMWEK